MRYLVVWILSCVFALSATGPCDHDSVERGYNLVARWSFDEASGRVVRDLSGNGNDGLVMFPEPGRSLWGQGTFSGTISMTASPDGHISVPASPSLNRLKTQVTVVALVYPRTLWTPGTPTTGFISLVQRQWRQEEHPDVFYLGYGTLGGALYYKWHVGLIDGETSLYKLPPGQDAPVTDKWVELAGTYDGGTGEMSLYVNGERIGRDTRTGEMRLDGESLARPLTIGAEINGSDVEDSTGEFDGYIDEVQVYDRALTEAEIKALAEDTKRPLR